MDLFRRIFGKSSEEATPPASTQAEPPKPQPSVSKDDMENDTTLQGVAFPNNEIPSPAARAQQEIEEALSDDETFSPLDPATRPVGPPPPPPGRGGALDGVTQPLNPEVLSARKTEHLAFGQSSDVGLVRTNNQDAAISFYFTSSSVDDHPDFGFFAVADGMGGHHDGEKASAITTKIMAQRVLNDIYMPLIQNENSMDRPPTTEALVKAVKDANDEVLRLVPEGGTTATAVIVMGDLAYIAHVGDSRAYLITKDGIEQITRDHSLVQRLIELDQLTPEEAETHPQKNVLYRALGQNELLEVDASTKRLPPNSRLLLCSDGLWGLVEERELFEVSMNNADPQVACDKLVALANTRGGTDNITAIVLKIS